jgi:hypothetical protein
MRWKISIFVVMTWAALAFAHSGRAEAKQVRFVGVHPIAPEYGGGFCYIEVPHVHVYEPPHAQEMYRVHDGRYLYVGDPVAYGYDGPKHAYYGPHPVPVNAIVEEDGPEDVEYCYLDGPHYHYYAPPPNVKFKVKGGVAWYVGDFDPMYERDRPRFAHINLEMKPIRYARPVVVVAPPPEFRGPIVEVDPVDPTVIVPVGGVDVHGPGVGIGVGVQVEVPAPSIDIHVGVPVAPVIIEPGVRVRHHDDDDDDQGHRHHDNGWHNGERKKGRF